MSSVDYTARNDANKALTVIFIIAIALASCVLIIKIVANRTASWTVQRLMVFALAFGTLLYSLFTLVVSARLMFSPEDVISCRTVVTSSIYGTFYLPFVYLVGLVFMAIELYTIRNSGARPSGWLARWVYMASPWLLGLLIVLPLTMAGIQWDHGCFPNFTLARHRAHVWVCILLPALGAVITATVVWISTKSTVSGTTINATQRPAAVAYSSAPPSYNHATFNSVAPNGVVIAPPPSHHIEHQQQQTKPGQFQAYDPPGGSLPPQYHVAMQDPQRHQYQHAYQATAPSMPGSLPQSHYPPPQNYAPPPPGFGTPYYGYPQPPSYSAQQPAAIVQEPPAPAGQRDVRGEAKALVVQSALMFILSLPYAVYILAYALNEDAHPMGKLTQIVVNDMVYWLSVLRWLLVSICWFKLLK